MKHLILLFFIFFYFSANRIDVLFAENIPSENSLTQSSQRVINYLKNYQFTYYPEISFPQFTQLDSKILEDISIMDKYGDTSYLSYISIILLDFSKQIRRPGIPLNRKEKLLNIFLTKFPLSGDEIINTSLSRWICDNTNLIGESDLLLQKVKEYRKHQEIYDLNIHNIYENDDSGSKLFFENLNSNNAIQSLLTINGIIQNVATKNKKGNIEEKFLNANNLLIIELTLLKQNYLIKKLEYEILKIKMEDSKQITQKQNEYLKAVDEFEKKYNSTNLGE